MKWCFSPSTTNGFQICGDLPIILGPTRLYTFTRLRGKRTAFQSRLQRSSRLQMFPKICALKNFAIFTGKHLCRSHFLKKLQAWGAQLCYKETPAQVVFNEYCKIFNSGFFYRTSPMAGSVYKHLKISFQSVFF